MGFEEGYLWLALALVALGFVLFWLDAIDNPFWPLLIGVVGSVPVVFAIAIFV